MVRQDAEERYRALFEHSPLPMWMYDRKTLRFVAVNEAALRHYGYTREELAAMTIADIRPPDEVAALEADVRSAHGLAAPSLWRHRKKDGTIITVEISANDFVEDGHEVRLVLANDVTERVQAEQRLRATEQQLRHAQKMDAIGTLATGIAHDFNNLLTVIDGYSCMLEESLAADSRREDAIEIRRATERAAGITRQLLAMSRESVAVPRAIDLDTIVEQFSPMLARFVGRRISLVTRRSSSPPVVADPGQVEQVLMNLAVNARDAMPNNNRFTIETRASTFDDDEARARGLAAGHYVELAATDTGTGMDEQTRARIFDPFFTTKEAGKGTGLGLAIVRGIVAAAGGVVSVYSELGHGTTFRLYFPASRAPATIAAESPLEAPRRLPPVHVLIVDDDHQVRALATRVLQDAGCHAVAAATPDEALRMCASQRAIDVILVDVVLADTRSDRLVRQLGELRPAAKILLTSGYPAGALDSAQSVLPKPFGPSSLRSAIARALGSTSTVAATSEVPAAAAPLRILVADDDELFRRATCRVLRRVGNTVEEAGNGREAIARLQTGRFDVVVSDVNMPECGGLDLMRAVRETDLDVPIILMSGSPDVESATAAVEFGAFRYLTKPFEQGVLEATVQHAARVHALARLRREAFSLTGAHAGVADRAGLEVRFGVAIEKLRMVFQPIVDASTGALYGYEALARTDEPSMTEPDALIDAAVELSRLPQLGRKIRALAAAAMVSAPTRLSLFVNLHPRDLDDLELVADQAPLTRIASRVVLEVTERSSLSNSPELAERIRRLRAHGFRMAVDDIGAGYSGLSSFTELVPEIVKIDMSLVRDVHTSTLKQRTIAALCRLCKEIGTLVVGEGVETHDERECLKSLGCDLLQGFLIGRPDRMPP